MGFVATLAADPLLGRADERAVRDARLDGHGLDPPVAARAEEVARPEAGQGLGEPVDLHRDAHGVEASTQAGGPEVAQARSTQELPSPTGVAVPAVSSASRGASEVSSATPTRSVTAAP